VLLLNSYNLQRLVHHNMYWHFSDLSAIPVAMFERRLSSNDSPNVFFRTVMNIFFSRYLSCGYHIQWAQAKNKIYSRKDCWHLADKILLLLTISFSASAVSTNWPQTSSSCSEAERNRLFDGMGTLPVEVWLWWRVFKQPTCEETEEESHLCELEPDKTPQRVGDEDEPFPPLASRRRELEDEIDLLWRAPAPKLNILGMVEL
jgi:hypothetical protein